jgi:hypothetical protein
MSDSERGRSPELDQARRILYPDLSPEEGWARIDEAFEAANKRNAPSREADLISELLARLRRFRRDA